MPGRLTSLCILVALAACSKSSRTSGSGTPPRLPVTKTYPPGSGRPQGIACGPRPPGRPIKEPVALPRAGDGGVIQEPVQNHVFGCSADAECTAGKNGRCNASFEGRGRDSVPVNKCSYDACQSDSDCKGMGPCDCIHSDPSQCLDGNCHVDADCNSGSCAEEQTSVCGGGVRISYFCRTADDTCTTNADCVGSSCVHVYDKTGGHWACQQPRPCPTMPNG